jgi:hypothetical protein
MVFTIIVSVLVAASGCAVQSGSGVDPESARQSLYAVLDETQELLGGTWKNQDDPTARGCSIPLFVEGEMYPALRVGSAQGSATSALGMVSGLWSDLGYEVTSTGVGAVMELQGINDVEQLVILRVNGRSMTLQGESECRPSA